MALMALMAFGVVWSLYAVDQMRHSSRFDLRFRIRRIAP